jgi:THAP domain-containing protein 4
MSDKSITSIQVFNILEGTWKGQGRGQFPGVTSFDYRETLFFTRRDEKTLAYEQRTQKLYDGQTEYLQSHWENGFISILENGDLQLVNIQVGGRSEILVGSVELLNAMFRIHFVSKTLSNDPRMVSSARTFELEGDVLGYEMEMQTTKVNQSTPHLKISLQRVNKVSLG